MNCSLKDSVVSEGSIDSVNPPSNADFKNDCSYCFSCSFIRSNDFVVESIFEKKSSILETILFVSSSLFSLTDSDQ